MMKRKKCYGVPLMERSYVEIESQLCASSINDNDDSTVTISKQKGNEDNNGTWNEESWGEWE